MMESYALKELSEAEMRRVEKHVSSCPKCRDHLEGELGWAAAMRSPFMTKLRNLIEVERKKSAKGEGGVGGGGRDAVGLPGTAKGRCGLPVRAAGAPNEAMASDQ